MNRLPSVPPTAPGVRKLTQGAHHPDHRAPPHPGSPSTAQPRALTPRSGSSDSTVPAFPAGHRAPGQQPTAHLAGRGLGPGLMRMSPFIGRGSLCCPGREPACYPQLSGRSEWSLARVSVVRVST